MKKIKQIICLILFITSLIFISSCTINSSEPIKDNTNDATTDKPDDNPVDSTPEEQPDEDQPVVEQPDETPEFEYETIAEVKAKEINTTGSVYGTVVGINSYSFLVSDSTGSILVYLGNSFDASSMVLGDNVYVTGSTSSYGKAVQFGIGTKYEVKSHGVEETNTPDKISGSDIDVYSSLSLIEPTYVEVTGVLSISGNYYNVTFAGANLIGSISYPIEDLTAYDGKTIVIEGYITGITSSRYLNILSKKISLYEESSIQTTTCSHVFENEQCSVCNTIKDDYIFSLYGEDVIIYTSNSSNPYDLNLNQYGSDVRVVFYTPMLSIMLDPYTSISYSNFYSSYTSSTSYEDSYYRTQHHLMSGDITSQGHLPESLNLQSDGVDIRCTQATYVLRTSGDYLAYIPNNFENERHTIYYNGAYTSLNEVSAYLLAFGEVPPNSNYEKSSGQNNSISDWNIYGRVNLDTFSGDTTKYPYEPLLPDVTLHNNAHYAETDFGTIGGYQNKNPYTGITYTQSIYNNGSRISRGAARFCYVKKSNEMSIDYRYVFYTYNHYNDFQEYLNYDNGFGTRFGNESSGNPYIASTSDWYNTQDYITLYNPTSYVESVRLKYQNITGIL